MVNSQDYNSIILGNVLSHETFTTPRGFVIFQFVKKNHFSGIFLTTNRWQKAAKNNCGQYRVVAVVVAVAVAVYHFSNNLLSGAQRRQRVTVSHLGPGGQISELQTSRLSPSQQGNSGLV